MATRRDSASGIAVYASRLDIADRKDLLTYGDLRMDRPDLRLPHPQCLTRRFVCQPLADLRPDYVVPGQSRTVAQILATLPERPWVRRFDIGR